MGRWEEQAERVIPTPEITGGAAVRLIDGLELNFERTNNEADLQKLAYAQLDWAPSHADF